MQGYFDKQLFTFKILQKFSNTTKICSQNFWFLFRANLSMYGIIWECWKTEVGTFFAEVCS